MFYLRHYCIYPYNEQLKTILENEFSIIIKHHLDVSTGVPKGMIFDVSELHPRFEELECILPPETTSKQLEYQFQHYQKTGEVIPDNVIITYTAHYLEEELQNAHWISARNIISKVFPDNAETVDTYQCYVKQSKLGYPLGLHEVQAENYTIKSPIKWGRHAFVSAYCHEERLFCNDTAYSLLISQGINGIRKLPVLRKSTGHPIEGIHQIEAIHTVPNNGIVGLSGMINYNCEICGMQMLRYTNGKSRYGILKGVLDDTIDIWKTNAMFIGRGQAEPHSAQRNLIISQKLYRLLVENKLDRGFVFSPLEIIDK